MIHNRCHILALCIFINSTINAQEEQEPAVPAATASSESSSSSSSSSSPTNEKKSILRKTAREGEKKKLQFAEDTQEHIHKPVTRSEDQYVQEDRKEKIEIRAAQKAAGAQAAPASQEEALQQLISFSATTTPEVEQIIDDCANDIVVIWNFFSTAPTFIPATLTPEEAQALQQAKTRQEIKAFKDAKILQEAKANFANLELAMKDYTRNVISNINRTNGQQSDCILDGYKQIFSDLSHQAFYELDSNPTVERLDDLLSNYMLLIIKKADALYTKIKEPILDKLFATINPDQTPKEQYDAAVSLGQEFLLNSINAEKDVKIFMQKQATQNMVKSYQKLDYAGHLFTKAKLEKAMIIKRVLPYAQNIGQTEQALMYIF